MPRGSYEPNGFHVSPSVPLYTSPLSAGNWAQRIQIHLGYAPLAADCPPTVIPDSMVGTQVAYRAVTSWQSALNQAAKCSTVYSYTATTETAATNQLQSPGSGNAGLAFTTIPIGSEVTRDGGTAPTLPTILYAPVAVTALDFGFNINTVAGGQVTTPVKLTPSLLARALTQVYKPDLPDAVPGPAWVQSNPGSWTADPSFQALNAGIQDIPGAPDFPLITGDHSAVNQQIWQWVQSDPATASWLDGGTDPSNPVTADPDYVALKLGQSPAADNFDEAYTGTLTCAQAVDLTATSDFTSPGECYGPLIPSPTRRIRSSRSRAPSRPGTPLIRSQRRATSSTARTCCRSRTTSTRPPRWSCRRSTRPTPFSGMATTRDRMAPTGGGTRSAPSCPGTRSCGPSTTCPTWPPTG